MTMRWLLIIPLVGLLVGIPVSEAPAKEAGVRIKELCRVKGARENALVGYGLVTGLAGTGDSSRSEATLQSISNILKSFSVNVLPDQIQSRNAAAVMITASLPPFAQAGDSIDVNVTSLGDARSLVGGTLVLTHLTGPNGQVYALAQGPVFVGGYKYDLNGNIAQKNHPTAASIPGGATIERAMHVPLMNESGAVEFVLNEPDFTTASRVAESLNVAFGAGVARALHAGRVEVMVPGEQRNDLVSFVTRAENLLVQPDRRAKIVINERTGTVVSGGDVRISQVSITHGDLKVEISTEFIVSQPFFVRQTGPGVQTQVVPDTTIAVTESAPIAVSLPNDTTVTDLVAALNNVKATSRDVITILRSIKRAGALHAELVIQ